MRRFLFCVAGILCLHVGPLAPATASAQQQRIRGFDVSQFQGNINWTTAYDAGVRFAFIRSSRGGPLGAQLVDPFFVTNMTNSAAATSNGQPVTIYTGNYHFGRPDLAPIPSNPTFQQFFDALGAHARSEADFFYGTVHDYLTPGHLRPVLDLEAGGGNSSPQGRQVLSFWANTFLDRFESLSGVEPLIYTNTNYATNYFDSSLAARDVWIANWSMPANNQTGNPGTGVFPTWRFWQYDSPNHMGAQYGTQSLDIDLDVVNGDMSTLQSFLIPVPEPDIGFIGLLAVAGIRLRRRAVTKD